MVISLQADAVQPLHIEHADVTCHTHRYKSLDSAVSMYIRIY